MKKKKKIPVKDKYYGFLFFIFAALLLIFGVVAVSQIRMAQFNKRMHVVEGSVTRIEDGVDELMDAMKNFKWSRGQAMDSTRRSDRGIEVGVGDRRETK